MGAVEALCSRAISLSFGSLVSNGKSQDVINEYLNTIVTSTSNTSLKDRIDRKGTGEARFTQVRILDTAGYAIQQVFMGSDIIIEADYKVYEPIQKPVIGFLITDESGRTVLRGYTRESLINTPPPIVHDGTIRCTFLNLPLMYGRYHLNLWLGKHTTPVDEIENVAVFDILQSDVYATGRMPESYNGGICYSLHEWSFINRTNHNAIEH
jgi:lipopolysaccharide transport system ATP-binding protein